jgi:hypothetical protein
MTLRFNFNYQYKLRTREKIGVNVYIVVEGGRDYNRALFNPFSSLESAEEKIRQDLFSRAHAVAGRWASSLTTAEDIFDDSISNRLASKLMAIASNLFSMESVSLVLNPLSPPLPQAPLPEKPRGEQSADRMRRMTSDVELVRLEHLRAKQEKAHLFDDPEIGQVLENEWQMATRRVVLSRDK